MSKGTKNSVGYHWNMTLYNHLMSWKVVLIFLCTNKYIHFFSKSLSDVGKVFLDFTPKTGGHIQVSDLLLCQIGQKYSGKLKTFLRTGVAWQSVSEEQILTNAKLRHYCFRPSNICTKGWSRSKWANQAVNASQNVNQTMKNIMLPVYYHTS